MNTILCGIMGHYWRKRKTVNGDSVVCQRCGAHR